MAEIGMYVDNKYEILKQIGQGGMSTVYLAMDKRLNKQWAVKELHKKARDKYNEVVIQSSIAEANMMKQLDHSALPRIVDILDEEDVIYVVMDYIEGEPLSEVIEKYGAQPQDVVIEWAKQLCEVLDYLHTREPAIIYRDMKPANVMLKPDGNLKLIDFGIAREYKEKNIADTVCLGTKGYAAPEQFGGRGQTDPRTDVYCLGATLYHLITGQSPAEPPYEMYPIRKWNANLSSGLEYIILKCTQLNPDERYQNCAELLYALNHYEEVDDAYKNKQIKKVKTFAVTIALTVVFIILGSVSLLIRSNINNQDYSTNISLAEKASSAEDKESYYLKAISILPKKVDAYNGLISTYKMDASFTVDEDRQFKQVIEKNLNSVSSNENYQDLAFEIGKLYWYYYDYGNDTDSNNQITRMTSSIKWFEDAISYGGKSFKNYEMASIYSSIGKFNRDITLKVEEANDKGMYKDYWKNIIQMNKILLNDKDKQEIVQLELYKLNLSSIQNYSRKFKSDGISQEKMQDLFDRTSVELKKLNVSTDKTSSLKNSLINKLDSTQASITNAFREKVQEEQ